MAAAAGADAFMTGNGGDNVLGYSQSAAPVADRYLTSGLGHEMVRSLLDVCRQTGCSLFDALGQAWRLATRPPAAIVRPDALFLAPEFLAGPGERAGATGRSPGAPSTPIFRRACSNAG